ncbi:MAG: ABC transporter ATP-binding protein [Acidimicrobiales bacterium]
MWMTGGVSEEDRLDRRGAEQVVRRTARMLIPYRRQVAAAVLCVTASVAATLAGPLLVRYAIDHGIAKGDSGPLWWAVAAYFGVAAAAYGLSRRQIVLVNEVGEGFLRDLRVRLFDHLQRLSLSFYDREKAGVIVARMTSDVDSMQELVQIGLLLLVTNVLLVAVALVLLAAVSWQLLAVCLLAAPGVVFASVRFKDQSNRAYLLVRDRIGRMLSRLQEGLAGVRVIQAYGRTPEEIRRFTVADQALYRAHLDSVKVQAWYVPVIDFAGSATTALVMGVGGWLAVRGTVTVGTVAFFVLTLSNLFQPIQNLSQLFNVVQSAGAALHKLYELLDTPVEVAESPGAVDLPERGELVLEGVHFAYPGATAPALTGVDLVLGAGERLALVGPTGAGKSTLAKLMARLYDPTKGSVSFGGVDLRRATAASRRARVVLAPQEGFLFNGTIADNLRIARPDASDAELAAALDALGVRERFEALDDGLATEVRERGSRLSAGEKQLVSLARAALADPAVLILDEATSSLDPGTEEIVESALERLMAGRTVVIVAHRLSTARRADRIAVVDEGAIVELGAHHELLALDGQYAALWRLWMSGSARAADSAAARG